LARLGFKVSARTVAKYMQRPTHRRPSPGWRLFLKQPGTIWACDFFRVQTILFRTFYVFFVIHHASRQVLHVHVTSHPTADWTAQQIVECCRTGSAMGDRGGGGARLQRHGERNTP
jgi:putative transposase